jgi:hypothetical protein
MEFLMDSYTTRTEPSPVEEDADITIVHYIAAPGTYGTWARVRRLLSRICGLFSTLALLAAALVPDMFNIPVHLRPWVFLTSILWLFAFCAGFFNL